MSEQPAEFNLSKADFDRRHARLVEQRLTKHCNRIGEIVEEMVAGNIVGKFKALGYKIDRCGRRYEFGNEEIGYGEIDLYLEDGDIAVLIEVKTNLTVPDIKEHIERLQKFRRDCDRKEDKRRFIAAVAGAVVSKEAQNFAYKQGMYVIVQSGDAVEILPVPDGFKAKEW